MSKIFTVVSGKGGVGKSTFCANIALSLCKKGKKVLLVDGDAGLRSLDLLLSVDDMVVYDWMDILYGNCDFVKARLFYDEMLQLLPAPIEEPKNLNTDEFKKILDLYRSEYDFIFIDAPAGIGEFTKIYAECADECIVVATPDSVSARSACVAGDELIKLGVKEEKIRLIINRFDVKAVKQGKLLNIDDVIDRTYIRLLGVVTEERDLMYASVTERSLSPYSEAKMAFDNISDRILGKEIHLYL